MIVNLTSNTLNCEQRDDTSLQVLSKSCSYFIEELC